MKTFRKTEVTRDRVTTIKTIQAESLDEAKAKFDNGEYDSIEEHAGDLFSVISLKIEEV